MSSTFSRHRDALRTRLPDGLIFLSGGRMITRNHDVDFVFRQKSNFLYLSGVEEPDCHLLLDPERGGDTLFIPRVDSHHRVWLGHVPSPEEAKAKFGFAKVMYNDEMPKALKKAHKGYKTVYCDDFSSKKWAPLLKPLRPKTSELVDALDELRACKTPGELEFMKLSSQVSSRAHKEVMRQTRAGMHEYQVQAIFEAECLKAGMRHLAYPSIVAAGANGAVLHYHHNNARLNPDDLLLIDAGAEHKGYAADITRTFPISGKFTRRQRDVYEIVLAAQKHCIDRSRPGITSAELHVESMRVIAEGLKNLKILKGDVSGLVEGGAVRLFYPHGLTHMLGLDVHDSTGGKKRVLKNPTKVPVRFVARLEPGFVITMEPGIYFIGALLNDAAQRKKHKGSIDFTRATSYLDFGGVRIEDDVVVQSDGPPLNLTDAPKEVKDVEEACRR
jgi:Xaa-Pro dipeptidase